MKNNILGYGRSLGEECLPGTKLPLYHRESGGGGVRQRLREEKQKGGEGEGGREGE